MSFLLDMICAVILILFVFIGIYRGVFKFSIMLLASVSLYNKGSIGFDGMLISVISMMSSFGPCTALANLGSVLQNTLASGRRVLDILDEQPVTDEVKDSLE